MDLLPQVKVKEQKKDEREEEIFRKLKVAKVKALKEKEIHQVLSDIEPEKKKIKKELDEFRAKAEKRKSDLLGEIIALEKKRDRIMEPFYKIKFEANEMMEATIAYEKTLKKKAKDINEKAEGLDIKETHINTREELLLKKESDIATRDIESIERSEKTGRARAALNAEEEAFKVSRQAKEEALDERDRDLKSREASLEARVQVADQREKDLDDERKHIQSQQQTLKAAFEEAKKKGIL